MGAFTGVGAFALALLTLADRGLAVRRLAVRRMRRSDASLILFSADSGILIVERVSLILRDFTGVRVLSYFE